MRDKKRKYDEFTHESHEDHEGTLVNLTLLATSDMRVVNMTRCKHVGAREPLGIAASVPTRPCCTLGLKCACCSSAQRVLRWCQHVHVSLTSEEVLLTSEEVLLACLEVLLTCEGGCRSGRGRLA